MQLDRRQTQLLCNLRIFDHARFIKREAFDSFGHVGARGDGRPTAECFEFDVGDDPVFVYADLEFHDVAAARERGRG